MLTAKLRRRLMISALWKDKQLTAQKTLTGRTRFERAVHPAVEYIQAARVRRMVMDAVAKVFEDIDVIVAPTTASNSSSLT